MKAEIKLIRIDNRLVHGQVGMSWTNTLDVDTIVVVDDETTNNFFSQKLMLSIAKAANVQLRFYGVQKFMQAFMNNESSQKLFLVVKNIQTARALAEAGLPEQKINIGNIHYEKGRRPFNKKVYLTEQDVADINDLLDLGYTLFYQDVPGTLLEKIDRLDYDKLTTKV